MVALYCSTGNVNAESVQLFAELVDVKPVLNVTPLSKKYGVEDSCIEIPLMVIGTDANGEGLDNDGHSNHEGVDFNDLDMDEVSNDIDNEGVNEG
ncbi:hypothetical protein J1N35_034432 [Gossypium stocksii]|uniref:Uncharacterized protein n=1 Tax=Gossypium stocksii TaxID=47602 RepID=A0A9D3US11_9ROSI|nr:hypothetical protein J1N35_034432 [Gossypium stocksii]